jgi:hypothetical protein
MDRLTISLGSPAVRLKSCETIGARPAGKVAVLKGRDLAWNYNPTERAESLR